MLDLSAIRQGVESVAPKYPIEKVLLFGSYANDNADESSDIDLAVEFSNVPVTLLQLFAIKEDLAKRLGRDVDIIRYPFSEKVKSFLVIERLVGIYEKGANERAKDM